MGKRPNHFATIYKWYIKSSLIKKQIFYTSKELKQLFEEEMHVVDIVSQKTFTTMLNRIVTARSEFHKCGIKRAEANYVVLCDNDNPSFV